MFRITYYAEGHLGNRKVTLVDVCGKTFDDFVIDEMRWHHANTPREQEAIILGVARREYPEVNWEKAHYTEIHQT